MEFKVGDRVRIRKWDDMVKEFGVDEDGDIKCSGFFTTDMKELCVEIAIITDLLRDKEVKLKFDNDGDGKDYYWNYSTDMIELYTENLS